MGKFIDMKNTKVQDYKWFFCLELQIKSDVVKKMEYPLVRNNTNRVCHVVFFNHLHRRKHQDHIRTYCQFLKKHARMLNNDLYNNLLNVRMDNI